MNHYILLLLAGTLSVAATCQPTQQPDIRLKESTVAPCTNQGQIFRDSVWQVQHHIEGDELRLNFIFTAACCQKIEVALQPGQPFPQIGLTLVKSGEICDCYCNYPVQATLVVPNLKSVPTIELWINKKPAGKIPTGF